MSSKGDVDRGLIRLFYCYYCVGYVSAVCYSIVDVKKKSGNLSHNPGIGNTGRGKREEKEQRTRN